MILIIVISVLSSFVAGFIVGSFQALHVAKSLKTIEHRYARSRNTGVVKQGVAVGLSDQSADASGNVNRGVVRPKPPKTPDDDIKAVKKSLRRRAGL